MPVHTTTAAAAATVLVIDPLNRTGKVAIPVAHVTETKGLDEYRTASAKREARDFSLCLLFQKGRCNAGARCHQIHVASEFIEHVRAVAASSKTCCAAHGDVHSETYRSTIRRVTVVEVGADEDESTYELSSFARTAGLEKVLTSLNKPATGPAARQPVRVPASRLCRLHQQRRCKFGQDCKNVHLCPDACPVAAAAVESTVERRPSLVMENVVIGTVPANKGAKCCTPVPIPSIDAAVFDHQLSCGVSCRSGSSTASSGASSCTDSPRRTAAPRSIDDLVVDHVCAAAVVKPLMTWNAPACVQGPIAAAAAKPKKTILVGGVLEEAWSTSDDSSAFDLSAFEATIRSLCEDLDRAVFSPNCAQRVRSQSRFFADLLA